jgi:sarcosine oxidase/L-pipecolate oxidase
MRIHADADPQHCIGSALNRGNFCIGIFLDLRKAFDTCPHDILLKKLSKLGVNGIALEWFKSYLSNRTQQVEVNGSMSNRLEITYGVLQGIILGPLLFLCYINDIYTATKLATFLFADDTTCLAEHSNLSELVKFVNIELNKLANWLRANKMSVNISKTTYILFHARGKNVNLDNFDVVFDSNEIASTPNPDPNPTQAQKNL